MRKGKNNGRPSAGQPKTSDHLIELHGVVKTYHSAAGDYTALKDVDLSCVAGQLGVAENGAVWVTGPSEPLHRAILFLTQHLVLVLPKAALRNNMHEAYAEIGVPQPGFGVFISGPSKTADIEQSLVIGAHGARSLHVIMTD